MYGLLATFTIIPAVLGHFVLNYPNSLGFDDSTEGTGPCGGFPITFAANDTNVTVGGFAVALMSTHPQAQWLFRATLQTQEPFNWTNLLPVVNEFGLGNFCLPALTVPSSFAGQRGVIQVQQNAADGVLYQCAAVNFMNESSSSAPSACTNASGLTATLTTQNVFSNTSSSTTSTSSGASATASKAAAMKEMAPIHLVGSLLAVLPVGLLLF